MAVLPSEIVLYQSISADSLGGGISAFVVPQGLNLYYNAIDFDEATTGSVAYRCFYLRNDSGTDTFLTSEIYISSRTPSPSTFCELGLGTAGLNGTEQTITSEEIAPVGVSFFPTSEGSKLAVGDLGPGEYYPLWIKRTCLANAVGAANDTVILSIFGDGGA